MEIVINDTNILIDLYNAGLLPYCKKLNLDFRTLDVVINEIVDSEQYTAVQSIIDDGTLSILFLVSRSELFSKRLLNIMVFVICPWKTFQTTKILIYRYFSIKHISVPLHSL